MCIRGLRLRLTVTDDRVMSLSAKGLEAGEAQTHPAEVYGAEMSRQTISTITDEVVVVMAELWTRSLRTAIAWARPGRH